MIAIASIAAWVPPANARGADPAGTYVVSACKAGSIPAPLAGWYPQNAGNRHVNTCADGGSFGLELSSEFFPQLSYTWAWRAPADVTVTGLRLWRRIRANRLTYAFIANGTIVDSGRSPNPDQAQEIENLNATELTIAMYCVTNPEQPPCVLPDMPPPYPDESVRFQRIEMVLRDELEPEIRGLPSGDLLAPEPKRGSANIVVPYADRGGGLSTATLVVDGVDRKVLAACVPPYTSPVPCALSGRVEGVLDTTSLSDGEHRVGVVLQDVAGNRATVGPFPVLVRNASGAAGEDVGATTARAATIRMRRARLNAPYGRQPTLDGTLLDMRGTPIPGARIDIAVRTRMRGAAYVPAGAIDTDAAGRFSLRLQRGTSRTIRLRYGTAETMAHIVTPAPVQLVADPRSTRNGRAVRFRGRVPGTTASTRVELQAWSDGKWIPFRSVALRNGRFEARYRFTRTAVTTRYRFRAVVHSDVDFPFAAGRSRVINVLVRA